MLLVSGGAWLGWTEGGAYTASHLLPPRVPSGIQEIFTGPRKQGQAKVHCPPHAGFLPTQRYGAIAALMRLFQVEH